MLDTSTVLTITLFCAAVFTSIAVTSDLITRRIPNALNVPVFVAALVAYALIGLLCCDGGGWLSALRWLGFSLAGFAVGFGILYVLWLIGGSGGGDVKMMGALGAWLGPMLTIYILFAGAALALLLTFGILAYSLVQGGMLKTTRRYLRKPDVKKARRPGESLDAARQRAGAQRRLVPFGLPIAVATWSCFLLFCLYPEYIVKLWG